MPTLKLTESGMVAGESFAAVTTIDAEGSITRVVTIAPAKPGQLTTRTDNDTGTLTMETGHGITTGARLDLFWAGGCRRGITVGTVAGNSVPFDLGAGDNLPTNLTPITAMVPQEEEFLLTGNNAKALVVASTARAQVTLAESDDTEAFSYEIPDSASKAYQWNAVTGGANPLATFDVAKVFFSQAGSSAPCEAKAIVLVD